MRANNLTATVLCAALAFACSGVENIPEPSAGPSVEPSSEPVSQDPSQEPVQENKILDLSFSLDGSASDLSPSGLTVNYVPGASLMVYSNSDSGRPVPRFYPEEPGVSQGSSFYRAWYSTTSDFADALAQGHSLECVLMCDFDPAAIPSTVVSAFSGLEKGGSGIFVRKTICFSVWTGRQEYTADSGIVPEKGVYYHVIGSYDAAEGIARIFVDGNLKASVEAPGKFNLPSNNGAMWYGVGIDATVSGLSTGAWKGDVASLAIYDAPLNGANATSLHEALPKYGRYTMDISSIDYLSGISLRPGSAFRLFAEGLKSGDKMVFTHIENGKVTSIEREARFLSDKKCLQTTVGKDLGFTDWTLLISRDGMFAPAGALSLRVEDDADEPRSPQIIAHRGWWLSKGVPQNSIAALAAAQDGGCEAAETDIWITTDGEVFVNHDGVLDGVRIESSTKANVEGLKLANGEPIPTLDAYLEQHAKNTATTLVIEIKTHSSRERNNACVDAAIAAVDRHSLADHVQYIAFDLQNCKRIAAARPGAMVGYLNGDAEPSSLKAAGIMQLDYTLQAFTAHPEWVQQAHQAGMVINMWTLDTLDDIKGAIQLGADYITTHYPERVALLRQKYFE